MRAGGSGGTTLTCRRSGEGSDGWPYSFDRIADIAELLQAGDLLWQALEQPHELRCTAARVELKKAVRQGLAPDLALWDWECNKLLSSLKFFLR